MQTEAAHLLSNMYTFHPPRHRNHITFQSTFTIVHLMYTLI